MKYLWHNDFAVCLKLCVKGIQQPFPAEPFYPILETFLIQLEGYICKYLDNEAHNSVKFLKVLLCNSSM